MNRSASLPLVASQTEGKRPVLVRYRLGKLINIISAFKAEARPMKPVPPGREFGIYATNCGNAYGNWQTAKQ